MIWLTTPMQQRSKSRHACLRLAKRHCAAPAAGRWSQYNSCKGNVRFVGYGACRRTAWQDRLYPIRRFRSMKRPSCSDDQWSSLRKQVFAPRINVILTYVSGGASSSPTIYVSFASRLHVIATKRAVRRTRVFKRRTLQHSVTPCRGASRRRPLQSAYLLDRRSI